MGTNVYTATGNKRVKYLVTATFNGKEQVIASYELAWAAATARALDQSKDFIKVKLEEVVTKELYFDDDEFDEFDDDDDEEEG